MSSDAAPGFAFAAGALDRAAHLREQPDALQSHFAGSGRWLALRADGKVAVHGEPRRLLAAPTAALDPDAFAHASFLGLDGNTAWFVRALSTADAEAFAAAHDARFIDLRQAALDLPPGEAGLAAHGRALLHWQSRKLRCGRCGAPTRFASAGHRARCTDAACGQEYFPRTDPAIIVIVTDGSRGLLGRQPSWPERRYSTLAGFVEPGETLEQAVAREVEEEVGIRVRNVRYHASQPWPFPAALMLGFTAEAETTAIRLGEEIAEAHWFEAAELPGRIARGEIGISPAISISHHLIAHWLRTAAGVELPPGTGWTR